MVSVSKTIVLRSLYEAPVCKTYTIAVASVIAASGGYGDNDNPGDGMGGNEYDL
jgi:hypothetical protein